MSKTSIIRRKMSGSDALVGSLRANDIDTLFALPGGQLDDLFDSVYRTNGGLKLIRSRHEQGAAYMAYGAALSTGKPSVYSVVPGPGVMNTMGALSTIWATKTPVMCLTGQIPSWGIGTGRGYLHEIPDQLATLSTLTKSASRIDHTSQTTHVMAQAFVTMQTGRPGPVSVEMAPDIMKQAVDVPVASKAQLPAPQPADTDLITEAAKLLSNAKNPLIYTGRGSLHAATEVKELAEMLQAPVTGFRGARGLIDDRHYLSQVFPAGRRLWKHADVVLAIGTRLKYPRLYWGVDKDIKIIQIEIDPVEVGRYQDALAPKIALVGDAKQTMLELINHVASRTTHRPCRRDELTALKQGLEQEFATKIAPQYNYLKVIREELPEDGFLCDEITQCGFSSWFAFPVYAPRTHVNCGFQGTLGYGFATAMGVAIANPNKKVISISGDGGFLYTSNELAVAVEYGVHLVAIVFNDARYANVYRQQKEWYENRIIAADLHNPDFVKYAESFGAQGLSANTPEELRTAIRKAFATKGPTVIEATQQVDLPPPWQFIL